jgi:hypothetical protein
MAASFSTASKAFADSAGARLHNLRMRTDGYALRGCGRGMLPGGTSSMRRRKKSAAVRRVNEIYRTSTLGGLRPPRRTVFQGFTSSRSDRPLISQRFVVGHTQHLRPATYVIAATGLGCG